MKILWLKGFPAIEETLKAYEKTGSRSKRKERRECLSYLRNHADALLALEQRALPYSNLTSLGAMESNVDKLVAHRMKTKGCSWSRHGARAMLAILANRKQLSEHAFQFTEISKATQLKERKRSKRTLETGTIPHASFPILDSGKISAPYAKLFKNIIHEELPL